MDLGADLGVGAEAVITGFMIISTRMEKDGISRIGRGIYARKFMFELNIDYNEMMFCCCDLTQMPNVWTTARTDAKQIKYEH